MSIVNKLLKFLGFIGIQLITLLLCFLFCTFFAGTLAALITAFWSIFAPLPALFTEKFYLVYLITGAPFTVMLYISVTYNAYKRVEKK